MLYIVKIVKRFVEDGQYLFDHKVYTKPITISHVMTVLRTVHDYFDDISEISITPYGEKEDENKAE